MTEPWTDEFAARVQDWCNKVASLGVDALIDGGLLAKRDFGRASGIVAEELFVRLCLLDYPPRPGELGKAIEG